MNAELLDHLAGRVSSHNAIGYVRLRDAATGKVISQVPGGPGGVASVTFSPDGRWIASGGWDKAIRLWDRSTGKLVRTFLGSRGFVRGLSFRPDRKQIISCSEDRGLRLWDVAGRRSLASFHGHMGFVHCVAFSPNRSCSGKLSAFPDGSSPLAG